MNNFVPPLFFFFPPSAFQWKKADVAKTSESSQVPKIELQSENEAEKVNGAAQRGFSSDDSASSTPPTKGGGEGEKKEKKT